MMTLYRRYYPTEKGDICYWVNRVQTSRPTLVFLSGLTADHRLFTKQLAHFAHRYPVLVWDAPAHGKSRPFSLDFSLMDKAVWLHGILARERIVYPVLIGQSMGGYVAQCFLSHYPAAGFVSIGSAPLQRKYLTAAELSFLRCSEWMFRLYPWQLLQTILPRACSETQYGRMLMSSMISGYHKDEYCALGGHGYRMIADAVESMRPAANYCPTLLICGEQDCVGFIKRYNRRWAKDTGFPLVWIPHAGHNANTDQPRMVNRIIEAFIFGLQ